MQAIVTKYLSPTNSRGPRIKASCQAGSLTVSYDHELNIDENHERACALLIAKLGWTYSRYGETVFGQLPDGTFAHVFNRG